VKVLKSSETYHKKKCLTTDVTFARDLGITVTNNLPPSVHIRNIVCKAQSRTIHRSFVSRDIKLLIRVYKTYVRPAGRT